MSGTVSGLLVYPAVDLAGGRAVRLLRGERAKARVVDPDPLGLARELARAGAPFLHLVDLDAAFGDGDNVALVEAIVAAVDCPVQVGGGVRDAARARRLRAAGVARVVLGTGAVRAPALLARLLEEEAEAVVVAADARAGRVTVAGWTEDAGEELEAFAARMRASGVRHLLVTGVERDGTGEGPDHALLERALAGFGPGVIASGGVGSLAHLGALGPLCRRGLAGVVVGSLLVDRRVTVAQALAAASGGS